MLTAREEREHYKLCIAYDDYVDGCDLDEDRACMSFEEFESFCIEQEERHLKSLAELEEERYA